MMRSEMAAPKVHDQPRSVYGHDLAIFPKNKEFFHRIFMLSCSKLDLELFYDVIKGRSSFV
jgi:hypothetical protein